MSHNAPRRGAVIRNLAAIGGLLLGAVLLADRDHSPAVFSDPIPTATLDLTTSTPSTLADPTARMPLFGAYGHRNTPAPYLETPTPDPFETDDVGWP